MYTPPQQDLPGSSLTRRIKTDTGWLVIASNRHGITFEIGDQTARVDYRDQLALRVCKTLYDLASESYRQVERIHGIEKMEDRNA